MMTDSNNHPAELLLCHLEIISGERMTLFDTNCHGLDLVDYRKSMSVFTSAICSCRSGGAKDRASR